MAKRKTKQGPAAQQRTPLGNEPRPGKPFRRFAAWIALVVVTLLAATGLVDLVSGFRYEPVGTNRLLAEADPNRPLLYFKTKADVFDDSNGRRHIGSIDAKFTVGQRATEGEYTQVEGFVWIWTKSLDGAGQDVVVSPDRENIRLRTNSDEIGELYKGARLERVWTNRAGSWSLCLIRAWAPSGSLVSTPPSGWFEGPRVTVLFEREGDVRAKYRFDAIWPLIPTTFTGAMLFLYIVRGSFAASSTRGSGILGDTGSKISLEVIKAALAIVTGVAIALIVWSLGLAK